MRRNCHTSINSFEKEIVAQFHQSVKELEVYIKLNHKYSLRIVAVTRTCFELHQFIKNSKKEGIA